MCWFLYKSMRLKKSFKCRMIVWYVFFSAGLMWQKLVKVWVRRKKRGKQIVPLATLRDTWQENFHKMYLMKKTKKVIMSIPVQKKCSLNIIEFGSNSWAFVLQMFGAYFHLVTFHCYFLLVQSLNFRDVQII